VGATRAATVAFLSDNGQLRWVQGSKGKLEDMLARVGGERREGSVSMGDMADMAMARPCCALLLGFQCLG
jgi:hypothetical protein